MSSGAKKGAKQASGPRGARADKPRFTRGEDKPRAARSEGKPRFARAGEDKPRGARSEGKPRFTRAGEDKPRGARSEGKPRFARAGEDKPRAARSEGKPRFARAGEDKPRGARSEGKPRFTRAGEDKPRAARSEGRPRFPRAGEDNGRLSRKVDDAPRARREGRPRLELKPKPAGKRLELTPKPSLKDKAAKPKRGEDKSRFTPRSQRGAEKTRSFDKPAAEPTARSFRKADRKIAHKPAAERETSERYVAPKTPLILSKVSVEPHPGHWLLTTREGAEQDLIDELVMAKVVDPAPRKLGPALVLSPKLPRREGRPMELIFARQGFEIIQSVKSHDIDEVTTRVVRSLRNQLAELDQYALHVWVPDSAVGNPLSSLADTLDERIERELARSLPELTRIDDATLRRSTQVKLAQVCVLDGERVAAGVMHANRTPSLAKGGRTRVRLTGDLPSRAARKVEEALAWLGVAPGPGETCVDLGAAPGGWTYVLAERRARVIAVDPANLRPDIAAKKGVRHVQDSAFTFTPDEHVDWLFCDMAWRPLEAAALLAKWGRKRWARILVANIKLPMNKKVEILARVRHILESEGDWKHVRIKQLYHDREEITLTALKA